MILDQTPEKQDEIRDGQHEATADYDRDVYRSAVATALEEIARIDEHMRRHKSAVAPSVRARRAHLRTAVDHLLVVCKTLGTV